MIIICYGSSSLAWHAHCVGHVSLIPAQFLLLVPVCMLPWSSLAEGGVDEVLLGLSMSPRWLASHRWAAVWLVWWTSYTERNVCVNCTAWSPVFGAKSLQSQCWFCFKMQVYSCDYWESRDQGFLAGPSLSWQSRNVIKTGNIRSRRKHGDNKRLLFHEVKESSGYLVGVSVSIPKWHWEYRHTGYSWADLQYRSSSLDIPLHTFCWSHPAFKKQGGIFDQRLQGSWKVHMQKPCGTEGCSMAGDWGGWIKKLDGSNPLGDIPSWAEESFPSLRKIQRLSDHESFWPLKSYSLKTLWVIMVLLDSGLALLSSNLGDFISVRDT